MKKLPKAAPVALAAVLFALPAGPWAQDLPALAASAIPAAPPAPAPDKSQAEGTAMSVEEAAQGNFGKLGVGVASVSVGSYVDEKGVQRSGPYATLQISVQGQPDRFTQADVHDGQTLVVADYRVRVDKVVPASPRGVVALRLWAPPKPPAKASKGWRRFFGL